MMQFSYRALDPSGSLQQGEAQAVSRHALLGELTARGWRPIDLHEITVARHTGSRHRHGDAKSWWRPRARLTASDILAMTRLLASLLSAGLTLERALQLAAELGSTAPEQALAAGLRNAVREGKSLAVALAPHRSALPSYYLSLIAAGEDGGALAPTLTRLASLMERQAAVRARVQSALIYPAILSSMMILTMIVLLGFVLPRFEALFAESDAPVPLSTRIVMWLGHGMSDYGVYLLGAAAMLAVFAQRYFTSERGQFVKDQWLLGSRLTFGLPRSLSTARWLRTTSTLLASGANVPRALKIARGTLGNRVLEQSLDQALSRVTAGESLSAALVAVGAFSSVAPQLARVGEETGQLSALLQQGADLLDRESEQRIERLLGLLVPVLTISMGLLVAGMISSVLVGLLAINDLAF